MSEETTLDDAGSDSTQGLVRNAEAIYREVLGREPYRQDARISLAVLLEQRGRRDEAIRLYEDAIRRVPCLAFYVNLGALWISEKRPDLAVAPLEKAVELMPACVPAHVNLAGAHSMLGNHADALSSYRKALKGIKGTGAYIDEYGALW